MILENIDNVEYDYTLEKARAFIKDKDGYYYFTNMNGSINIPGGTVENDEDFHLTIERELEEEVGLITTGYEYLGDLYFLHENFPNLKSGGIGTRLNRVHVFYKEIGEANFEEPKRTDFEIENNMDIFKCKLEEIDKYINIETTNSYKKFMDIEIKAEIDLLKKVKEHD